MVETAITPFTNKLSSPLNKREISVLQINLGKRCNLACNHCHVEASPNRTEELSLAVVLELIELIYKFPEIEIVDLTGGAPEMNYGFKPLLEAAIGADKQVIVRSNLTIYFVDGFGDLPEYFAQNQVRIVASLPCYLADNVDKMRGNGVFDSSIKALQWLNKVGYGNNPDLILDLVYNSPLPNSQDFSLAPEQTNLNRKYKTFLQDNFGIVFNNLLTITNLPVGRTKFHLEKHQLYSSYLEFLELNFNPDTTDNLMCLNQISVDYLGNVYDCDFNQMMNLPAKTGNGKNITISKLLELGNLNLMEQVQTADYCYGCTAGCGSSCSGALV
ncbi:arsenosugar biosynthesis radical SAM (seleno)protein ArsS [Cronbergia sp. UHCC 0137]|uniref:arsenosugar biosynthesis radical SAM (seleno)protein ArsS n=1 Tax=Cronbergia sp. UHCC 0137 TaxID=3110239 RepID=UPI002B213025|nr:arsenosugar biosynthesis radical SAM (seleno)protein ArsS [Cronbergia sp. UHCC 0137]MEA5619832.1 arsenosugar biosynthesis radical SAM (seleno)protein ArsS [Cronbergia sp. UHCC 0137]